MRRIGKLAWMLALLSGVLQALIFPKFNLWWLCWVALAPLIVAILRARDREAVQVFEDERRDLRAATPWQGFLLGYACGILWYALTCYWVYDVMHLYGRLAPPLAALLVFGFCLYLGLHHALFGLLLAWAARRSGRRALALAPFLWVAIEFVRARITSVPWELLGYAQVDNIPMTRLATVAGVYALSFEIALVNAAFAAAFLLPRARRATMLVAACVAAGIVQLGVLYQPEPAPVNRTARLVQQNIPILDSWSAEYYGQTLRELAELSGHPKGTQAGLVVWPESPAPFFIQDPQFAATMAQVAGATNSYVIAGSLGARDPQVRGAEREIFNSASVYGPDGSYLARYDKVHLVPWGEYVPLKSLFAFAEKITKEVGNFGRGTERTVFTLPASGGQRVAVFICYEAVFPEEVRLFAKGGAEVLINISNDGWYGETAAPFQHLNIARMRAIENGRWLLRATNTGVTGSIDPYGRLVMQAPRNTRVAIDAPYAAVTGTTFYTRFGDWFAWLCVVISISGLLWRSRKEGHSGNGIPLPVNG